MHAAEFDALTPAELAEYRSAWLEREKRLDARAGVLAATLANCHRDPKRRRTPYAPGDFFPSLGKRSKAMPTRAEWVNGLAAVTGGLPDDWKGWRPGDPQTAD